MPASRRNTCPAGRGSSSQEQPAEIASRHCVPGTSSARKGRWFFGAPSSPWRERSCYGRWRTRSVRHWARDDSRFRRNRARLLLLKRDAFSHEAEMRAIFVQQRREPREPLFRVPVEPAAVFDEISFGIASARTFIRAQGTRRKPFWGGCGFHRRNARAGSLSKKTLLQVGIIEDDNSSIGRGGTPSIAVRARPSDGPGVHERPVRLHSPDIHHGSSACLGAVSRRRPIDASPSDRSIETRPSEERGCRSPNANRRARDPAAPSQRTAGPC